MHVYEAYVRTGGLVTRVQVTADNVAFAIAQLKGMYGENNIVHLPRQIS